MTAQASSETVVAPAALPKRVSVRLPILLTTLLLAGAMLLGIAVGPVGVGPGELVGTLLTHVPGLGYHTATSPGDQAIIWQLRLPRVVLAALVGAMLAAGLGAGVAAPLFGFLAVVLASINIFGGFTVTQRMLFMFQANKKKITVVKPAGASA